MGYGAFQEICLGNSMLHHSKRVCPDTIFLGVVSVTDPVVIHLKDIDGWDTTVLNPVVKAEVRVEGNQLLI